MENFLGSSTYFRAPPQFIEVSLSIAQHTSIASPTVCSFSICADDQPFLNLDLMESGLAVGWTNLMSECWGHPAVDETLLREQVGQNTLRKPYRNLYHVSTDALQRALRERNDADNVNGEATQFTEFVSCLIECPRFETLHSDFGGLANDKVFWLDQGITIKPWAEYLRAIWGPGNRLIEVDALLDLLKEDSIFVLITSDTNELMERLESSSSDPRDDRLNPTARLPPVGLIANNVHLSVLSKVIGVIASALRPLAEFSQDLLFVEPYFAMKTEAFGAIAKVIVESQNETYPLRNIEVHTELKNGQSMNSGIENIRDYFSILMRQHKMSSQQSKLKVMFRTKLHDRFFLTELGGIKLSAGFDEAKKKPDQEADLYCRDGYEVRKHTTLRKFWRKIFEFTLGMLP